MICQNDVENAMPYLEAASPDTALPENPGLPYERHGGSPTIWQVVPLHTYSTRQLLAAFHVLAMSARLLCSLALVAHRCSVYCVSQASAQPSINDVISGAAKHDQESGATVASRSHSQTSLSPRGWALVKHADRDLMGTSLGNQAGYDTPVRAYCAISTAIFATTAISTARHIRPCRRLQLESDALVRCHLPLPTRPSTTSSLRSTSPSTT